MSNPFIGEINMFGGNFAPRGHALCDGQLLAISQNTALFSILGTIYGGDGRTTFGLPEMRGRIPIGTGSGPGLSPRTIGQRSGAESVTLTTNELPSHTHTMQGSTQTANIDIPTNAVPAITADASYKSMGVTATMKPTTAAGSSSPHNNLMPFQCINYIIALVGTFPSRN